MMEYFEKIENGFQNPVNCQSSMMKPFWENSERLEAVHFFLKKAPS